MMTATAPARPSTPTAATEWSRWGTTMRLVVTEEQHLKAARAAVEAVLDEIGAACDRFCVTSELNRLHGSLPSGVAVSGTLASLVGIALEAARQTDGDVDPTLGSALMSLGYDRDLGLVDESEHRFEDARATGVSTSIRVPGWRRVSLIGTTLTVPADLTLDLGATAKALAADTAAARVFERFGCGVLVSLGGDIATAGPAPSSGWQVSVRDLDDDPESVVTLAAGHALATSSTQKRRWQTNGRSMHHILDPRLGLPAEPVWRTVTVAAASCVQANTMSTASVVRGYRAVGWIAGSGFAARLVDANRRVLTLGGWPDENSVHVLPSSPAVLTERRLGVR